MSAERPTTDDWLAAGCPSTLRWNGMAYDWSCFTDEIGFCGCGCPEEATAYLLRVLKALGMSFDDMEAHTKELYDALGFGRYGEDNTGACYTILYWIHDKGWSEHGGAVPGWLSEKGKRAVQILEAMVRLHGVDDAEPPASARGEQPKGE